MSLPTRGVWIEIPEEAEQRQNMRSLPTRGVWIEMYILAHEYGKRIVAPHTGSVD